MKTFYWLLKREFWEHRGGFLMTPVITGGIFLLLNLMGIITGEVMGPHFNDHNNFFVNMHSLNTAMDQHSMAMVGAGLDMIMYSSSMIISMILGFVIFFYCLGSLYDDRRDRSLLFWKSLPISDTGTVLSKVISATVVAPLIAMVVGVLTGIGMLLMFAIALSFHGVSVWSLLMLSHPFRVIGTLIGLIPMYVLWALPSVGWLMLCSAWARSKPFLWAVVIPVALGIAIGWFNLLGMLNINNGSYWRDIVGRLLLSVFPGGWIPESLRTSPMHDEGMAHALDFLSLQHTYSVLGQANVWIGAAAGLAMIAGATWFRRWRDDS